MVSGVEQFGTLATSYARAPMATQAFQTEDFGFINLTNTPPADGPQGEYSQQDLKEFAAIKAAGGEEFGSQSGNPVVRFFSNMFVGNMLK